MSKITFVFATAPYSCASGREGLDAVLAASAYSEDISLIFIAEGVYQLLNAQNPQNILLKNHSLMFKLLQLYDISQIYVCGHSLNERGLNLSDLIIQPQLLNFQQITQQLSVAQKLLSF